MNQRVKTRLEIAEEYGISRRTLYTWCKNANLSIPERGALNPQHQNIIYETFGKPLKQSIPKKRRK